MVDATFAVSFPMIRPTTVALWSMLLACACSRTPEPTWMKGELARYADWEPSSPTACAPDAMNPDLVRRCTRSVGIRRDTLVILNDSLLLASITAWRADTSEERKQVATKSRAYRLQPFREETCTPSHRLYQLSAEAEASVLWRNEMHRYTESDSGWVIVERHLHAYEAIIGHRHGCGIVYD